MANYNDTENSIIGTDYLKGVLSGFEDYIVLPVGQDQTVCIVGNITHTGGGVYNYDGDEIIIRRTSSGYQSVYEAETIADTTGTITIDNEYYCRGNVGTLSVIETFKSQPATNFAVISLVWGVLFCFVLKSLLGRRSARV